MKANIQLIKKRRSFSEEFKRSIVSDFESGKFSVQQLSQLHNICDRVLYRWIYKFSTFNKKGYRIVEMKESSETRLKELQQRIQDLEQIVGQKQIKIDYLEKMIEIAKDDFQIDIKKNFSTLHSNGSETIKRK